MVYYFFNIFIKSLNQILQAIQFVALGGINDPEAIQQRILNNKKAAT